MGVAGDMLFIERSAWQSFVIEFNCFVNVCACAVGWTGWQTGQEVTINNRWRLWTTHPSVAAASSSYRRNVNAGAKIFVEYSCIIARNSAQSTENSAEIFWKS